MESKRKILGTGILLITALIWGLGFPMQSMALVHVGAATLTCVRNVIAGLFLLLVIAIFDRIRHTGRHLIEKTPRGLRPGFTRREAIGGLFCGILLGTATTLQQIGLSTEETDSGKAAFITALYMVIVPLLGIFRRRFPSRRVFFSVGLAVIGSYLLSANIVFTGTGIGGFISSLFRSGFHFAYGDLMVLLCAFVFAAHVVVIDIFTPDTDGIRMSCLQFFVASVITLPVMLIAEAPSFSAILMAALPILYLGIFSSGVAYTGQIIGQKYIDVTVATLVLSLESVFGVLGGAVLLGEYKTVTQLVGCAVVFAAVIIAELPSRKSKK